MQTQDHLALNNTGQQLIPKEKELQEKPRKEDEKKKVSKKNNEAASSDNKKSGIQAGPEAEADAANMDEIFDEKKPNKESYCEDKPFEYEPPK